MPTSGHRPSDTRSTLRIDPLVHRRLKVLAALEGRPLYEMINTILEAFLAAEEKRRVRASKARR